MPYLLCAADLNVILYDNKVDQGHSDVKPNNFYRDQGTLVFLRQNYLTGFKTKLPYWMTYPKTKRESEYLNVNIGIDNIRYVILDHPKFFYPYHPDYT